MLHLFDMVFSLAGLILGLPLLAVLLVVGFSMPARRFFIRCGWGGISGCPPLLGWTPPVTVDAALRATVRHFLARR